MRWRIWLQADESNVVARFMRPGGLRACLPELCGNRDPVTLADQGASAGLCPTALRVQTGQDRPRFEPLKTMKPPVYKPSGFQIISYSV